MLSILVLIIVCLCASFIVVGVLMLYRHTRSRTVSPSGKAVVITGCDRGFGNDLAKKIDGLGYTVFACCLNSSSDGAKELSEVSSSRLKIIQLDVTNEDQIQSATNIVQAECESKGVWALVNNAGIGVYAETEWCTMKFYENIMNVNLFGMIRMTKSFLPLIRKSKGRIINVASLAGRIALPGFTAYTTSKFAVIGFSDSLRREMGKFGVSVITVEPNLYRTLLTSSDLNVQLNQELWSEVTDIVKADYGEEYFNAFLVNMRRMLVKTSKRTYLVIDDLVHAVTAEFPKIRYVPKFRDYIGGNLLQCLPVNVLDFALKTVMSFRTKPRSLLRRR